MMMIQRDARYYLTYIYNQVPELHLYVVGGASPPAPPFFNWYNSEEEPGERSAAFELQIRSNNASGARPVESGESKLISIWASFQRQAEDSYVGVV